MICSIGPNTPSIWLNIIIFIIGKILVNWANRLFAKILAKRKVEAGVQTFLKSMVNILLLVMLGLAVIGKLGIELTGFAALLASAGVAIGMALSGNLQNFAGGIIILIFRPYKVGDYIEASTGASGTVQEIQIFHTVLVTPDNKVVYIPNGALSTSNIVNYSEKDTRRVDLDFSIAFDADAAKAQKLVADVLAAHEMVLKDPAIFVRLGEPTDSALVIKSRAWVKSEDYWTVYFDVLANVKEAFGANGIEVPHNKVDVHIKKD